MRQPLSRIVEFCRALPKCFIHACSCSRTEIFRSRKEVVPNHHHHPSKTIKSRDYLHLDLVLQPGCACVFKAATNGRARTDYQGLSSVKNLIVLMCIVENIDIRGRKVLFAGTLQFITQALTIRGANQGLGGWNG